MSAEWIAIVVAGLSAVIAGISALATIRVWIWTSKSVASMQQQVDVMDRQLSESQRQFSENNRPILHDVYYTPSSGTLLLGIQNTGTRRATNIKLTTDRMFAPAKQQGFGDFYGFVNSIQGPFNLALQEKRMRMIDHGELDPICPVEFDASYEDDFGNKYSQKITIAPQQNNILPAPPQWESEVCWENF